MHYFTNISVRVLEYGINQRVSNISVAHEPRCVCTLNKVEVRSSAIAARGSYVRPESLLGLRTAAFAELLLAEGFI